ncbi:DUF3604 domain-containing protein [Curvibacter sp. APW13]|uniref:DUF3604 domain-containing protein n=1 Tax=Curvibacter sp. APW13 TaxID=3077236 RepID=UPI0028DF2BC0|nr:DUF3604 domain-containing protein [Curvibacter sp. APW13]MDT8991496.1 DUF3604 domain-containing protein [Curvibacter sp. APW13]
MKWLAALLGIAVLGVAGFLVFAQRAPDLVLSASKSLAPDSSEAPAPNPLRNAYFGELHSHTSYSLDAKVFGNELGPRDAYRFAKGETVPLGNTGLQRRIDQPLDFAAVTDHAEGMGLLSQCHTPGSGVYWTMDCIGVRYRILLMFPRLFKFATQSGAQGATYHPNTCGDKGADCIRAARSVWEDNQNAANEHYQPGKFTTFIGFEYSPTLARGGMLHRNVIFRGANVPPGVFGSIDGFVEDLMRWLDTQCTGTCQAMAIPHNPNFSWGLMFGDTNSNASPVTRESLQLRAKYERLVEVFQAKGSSECMVGVGSTDEECAFENLFPACSAAEAAIDPKTGIHAPQCVSENDMVRNVLKRGLAAERTLGFNPYKFGFVGGTDNHNGLPGDTDETTFQGHAAPNDASPELRLGIKQTLVSKSLGLRPGGINPGGLTGVWAEQNTRESIWDGLKRRESWGTSGTRIRARFFAGYDLPANLHQQADLVTVGYARGVPMGGDLQAAPAGKSPRFVAWATRDAHSAPLQKLQVVKGWVEGDTTREQVYDVACSNGLRPDPKTHRCPDNGATVNLKDCSISQDRGAPELATTWTDPDFRPGVSAFYYLRVLENPVCRFSQRDALALGIPLPEGIAATVRERAWTSPIWYTPH